MGESNQTEFKKLDDIVDMEKADAAFRVIELCMGVNDEGEECYAYVAIKPSKAEEYAVKIAAGEDVELEEYGEILEEGTGTSIPSAEVQERMKKLYGVEHDFEDQLQKHINV